MIPQFLHFFNSKIARIFSRRTFVFGLSLHIAVIIHDYCEYYAIFPSLLPIYSCSVNLFSTVQAWSNRTIFIYGLLQDLRHYARVQNGLCIYSHLWSSPHQLPQPVQRQQMDRIKQVEAPGQGLAPCPFFPGVGPDRYHCQDPKGLHRHFQAQ